MWILFVCQWASAQSHLEVPKWENSSVHKLTLPERPSSKKFIWTPFVEENSFVSSNQNYFGEEIKSERLTSAGVSVSGQNQKYSIYANARFSVAESEPYLNVGELSRNTVFLDKQMIVGRHRYLWSRADEFWRQDNWQPQFKWNRLRPEQQGLTGFFWQRQINHRQQLSLFASPLFIPSHGVNFKEENGQLVSKNPWFRPPPPVIELSNQFASVQTSVKEPKYEEVLFKPSFALQWKQILREDSEVQVSYAYKPLNTPRLAYEYFIVSQVGNDYAQVTVHPDFPYHHLFNLEANWLFGDVTGTPSLTFDKPMPPENPMNWITQSLPPSVQLSAMVSWKIQGDPRRQLRFGRMTSIGDVATKDLGEFSQPMSQFEFRQIWLEPWRLGYEQALTQWGPSLLKLNAEWTFDGEQGGGLFLSEIRYIHKSLWQAYLRLDMMGMVSNRTNPYSSGFISTYRANDTLSAGYSYDF